MLQEYKYGNSWQSMAAPRFQPNIRGLKVKIYLGQSSSPVLIKKMAYARQQNHSQSMGGEWPVEASAPPGQRWSFFPANRACRKSVPCSSMILCCRRKFGACPKTRKPKRKKCFAMETWELDGAKGVADFCSSGFYCLRILNAFWLSTGGGPRQLGGPRQFTFASRCCHIIDHWEFRVLIYIWRLVVARNTRGRKMVIIWLTIWI